MHTQTFTTYHDVLAHLDQRGLFHMDFGLERIGKVLEALHVQRPAYDVIQVIGTNGKGSTSTFLASLAKAHGKRVGLYTSPHFITPRERIRIDGLMLDESAWPRLANAIFAVGGESLTYFEFLTVLAALAFAEAGVDVAIMEAGLGGSWDGTTAMAADLLCATPIGLDHQAVLGNTIAAIAKDKAGAIREGQTVFIAPQEEAAMAEFVTMARACAAELVLVDSTEMQKTAALAHVSLGLRGPHQYINASVALRAWEHLSCIRAWHLDEEAVSMGLQSARIAGRYDTVSHSAFPCPIILDGAHNPHGLQSLVNAIHHDKIEPSAVIFACLADKDLDGLMPFLLDIGQGAPLIIPTIQNNERALDGAVLAEHINLQKQIVAGKNLRHIVPQATAVPNMSEALSLAKQFAAQDENISRDPSAPIVICGSLYLLAEFFTMFPELLD
ncbi:MAG: bifunctional folylpolyglutamate synthase/dihydrofolate synthase [Pseudomonadota bacterium]